MTRLAHGVPVGGELDYLDDGTIAAAMRQRTKFYPTTAAHPSEHTCGCSLFRRVGFDVDGGSLRLFIPPYPRRAKTPPGVLSTILTLSRNPIEIWTQAHFEHPS